MNCMLKKTIIYSMLGLMQVGMFSSVAAAAPVSLYNNDSQQISYLSRGHGPDRDHRRGPGRDDRRDHDRRERERREQERREQERRRIHNERKRIENERHEREMRRRAHESRKEWRERQEREKQRHDREMRTIAALLIGIAIGSANN
ncbi:MULTISPECIES: hypothetical protein [Sporomusa]|jgi:hypothetical protein|uniref:hypothetical protein n=1 Tax=Sporomusa TaxID=2375 RepID=UPI00202DE0FD|nr:hypothetical protein [Sporomusa sphaeroides]MCM0761589.1 hypothetical protein [Sporomusa sphaeroides DSM 2875]HML31939.1 hypothetical protein [Sporomusa sphaeroides]